MVGTDWTGSVGNHSWGWRYPDGKHSDQANMHYMDGHVTANKTMFYQTDTTKWYTW